MTSSGLGSCFHVMSTSAGENISKDLRNEDQYKFIRKILIKMNIGGCPNTHIQPKRWLLGVCSY